MSKKFIFILAIQALTFSLHADSGQSLGGGESSGGGLYPKSLPGSGSSGGGLTLASVGNNSGGSDTGGGLLINSVLRV